MESAVQDYHDHDDLFSEPSDQENAVDDQPEQKELTDEATRVLRTRWEDVYQLSDDGATYMRPRFLRGVPVGAMPGSYQSRLWAKLGDYLAKEEEEERLKAEYNERIGNAIGPVNKTLRDRHKMHKDNVSKHRKIREVFGGTSTIHPNQVISKGHLPVAGLCEQEVMYMLGCKYTDLVALSNRGLLAMDPWDFLRWRIGQLVEQKLMIPGQSGRKSIRGIIFGIRSEKSDDPIFREIILRSARLAGTSARYGHKKKQQSRVKEGPLSKQWRGQTTAYASRQQPTSTASSARAARQQSQQAEVEQRRAERKAALREEERRRAQGGSGYQGVNAWRQQQRQDQPSFRGGPCGG